MLTPTAATPDNNEDKRAELHRAALEYHEFPTPGKIAIAATKQLVNQRDLALAYSSAPAGIAGRNFLFVKVGASDTAIQSRIAYQGDTDHG